MTDDELIAAALERAKSLFTMGRARGDIAMLQEAESLAKQARALAEAIGRRERLLPRAIRQAEVSIKNAIRRRDREKWMR